MEQQARSSNNTPPHSEACLRFELPLRCEAGLNDQDLNPGSQIRRELSALPCYPADSMLHSPHVQFRLDVSTRWNISGSLVSFCPANYVILKIFCR